ncbi:MAG TPA: YbhN family protein, partial [Actinomycetota bacterium]
ALAAFAFVRLVSALPITPGGLGVVELGLTAALVTAGGDEAGVVAAVLVYRALTYLLPIPIGLFLYLTWRKGSEERRARVEAGSASAAAPSRP